jgi:hypothetical protein
LRFGITFSVKVVLRDVKTYGVAITDFIMHPTLESYERHIQIFLRYMLRGEVKGINYYSEKSLRR